MNRFPIDTRWQMWPRNLLFLLICHGTTITTLISAEEILDVWCHQGTDVVVTVSPDAQIIASGGNDNGIRFWTPTNQRSLGSLGIREENGKIVDLAYSPDGRQLAASIDRSDQDNRGRVALIEARTNSPLLSLPVPEAVAQSIDFSADGTLLAATIFNPSTWNGGVVVWDTTTGQRIALLQDTQPRQTYAPRAVCFSPNNQVLATSGYRGTIEFWDVSTVSIIRTIHAHAGTIYSLAYSPDGTAIASSASGDQEIKIWDTTTAECMARWIGPGSVASLAFSPDGNTLAVGSGRSDKGLSLWSVADGQMKAILTDPRMGKSVGDVAYFGDQPSIIGSVPGGFKIWNASLYDDPSYALEALLSRDPAVKQLYEATRMSCDAKEVVWTSQDHYEDEHLKWLHEHEHLEKLTLVGAHPRYRQTFKGTGLRELRELPNLREIELSDMTVESLEGLADLQQVKTLRFSGTCRIPAEQWIHLARMTQLEELDLSGAWVGGKRLGFLQSLVNLRVLRLIGSYLSDRELYNLIATEDIEHLKYLTKLEFLELEADQVGPKAGQWLANLKNLRHLDIALTDIDDGCKDALGGMPELRRANLGRVGRETIGILADLPALEELSFSAERMVDSDLVPLATCRSLKTLTFIRFWTPTSALEYVRRLPKMSRDERLTYTLIRVLLKTKESVADLQHMQEIAPLYSFVPSSGIDVFGQTVFPWDSSHPEYAEYMIAQREMVELLQTLEGTGVDARRALMVLASEAKKAANRAFADDPDRLAWAGKFIEENSRFHYDSWQGR